MAILNNIVRSVAPKNVYPSVKNLIDATVTYNQGDVLVLKAGLVQRPTAEADSAQACGVATLTVVLGKEKSPYSGTAVDAAEGPREMPGPVYGVVAKLKLKAADTFNEGDPVYIDIAGDAESRTVTTTIGTSSAIGYFVGKSITAAAGDEGEVHVGAQIDGGLHL